MGRLRAHQAQALALRRQRLTHFFTDMFGGENFLLPMSEAELYELYQKIRDPSFSFGQFDPFVLAFLFAHPDSETMGMVDVRGDYFDLRTGDTWDLFFPGYYRSSKGQRFEKQAGARHVGRLSTRNWYFSASEFNALREHVERSSGGRWQYSGEVDLVLVNGWLAKETEPTIDWASTISGQITDQASGTTTLTLASVIERITRDIQTAAEDPSYGIGAVTDGPLAPEGHFLRDFMVNALAGIAAALGVRALGA